MGLFDSLATRTTCPACGMRGATKFLWIVKCTNMGCTKYDSEYAASRRESRIIGKMAAEVFPHLKGNFDPEAGAIQIRYANFRGDKLVYTADPRGAYTTGEHLVVRVAPSGRRIAFQLSSIQNRSEVESLLPKESPPNPQERRILNHHLRRGTTSRLFEEVREKYPDYQP